MTISLRALELGDLGAVEAIEVVSYPAPWSRSMFTTEIAKPSALSLGAFDESGTLMGYLILSRYVDAWHVMNVAVHPDHRRQGIASALLTELFIATRDDARRGLHARGARVERGGDRALRAVRIPLARGAARVLHGQP